MSAKKHETIAEVLRAEIVSGVLAPGSQLPSESQLIERFGASQGTIRAALATLKAEGILRSKQGVGVFVREFRPIVRSATQRLSSKQWGTGKSMWQADIKARHMEVDRVEVFRTEAPDNIAEILGTSDVWVRDRRFSVEGRPVQLATSYLPASIVDGSPITQIDTGEGGTYARLLELGFKPEHFQEELRSRTPAPDEVKALNLQPGTPVLEIARTAFTADGLVVELNRMVLDALAYVLRYDIQA